MLGAYNNNYNYITHSRYDQASELPCWLKCIRVLVTVASMSVPIATVIDQLRESDPIAVSDEPREISGAPVASSGSYAAAKQRSSSGAPGLIGSREPRPRGGAP